MSDTFPGPGAWNGQECVTRMIRGAIAKVRSLERDGAITATSSANIRDALARAILRVDDAKWTKPVSEPGVLIEDPRGPKPEPLPTEPGGAWRWITR